MSFNSEFNLGTDAPKDHHAVPAAASQAFLEAYEQMPKSLIAQSKVETVTPKPEEATLEQILDQKSEPIRIKQTSRK